MKQGKFICHTDWNRYNIVTVMASVGGLLGTVYLITRTLLINYLYFKFDSSLMKRLYYEEGEDD